MYIHLMQFELSLSLIWLSCLHIILQNSYKVFLKKSHCSVFFSKLDKKALLPMSLLTRENNEAKLQIARIHI